MYLYFIKLYSNETLNFLLEEMIELKVEKKDSPGKFW